MSNKRVGLFMVSLAVYFVFLAWSVSPGTAYEIPTHDAISRQSAKRAIVDRTLKESLGVSGGLEELIKGKSIEDWIADGSAREDDIPRFFRHFHDPLRPWDDSGFGLGLLRVQSSIRWGQNALQSWSWPNVRHYHLQALTAPTKAERETAFANTFRGLGQMIHLLQDAASPAHTRNDPHVAYNYESLVRDVQRDEEVLFKALLADFRGPDPGWHLLAPNPLAPVPIARLFDTDQYTGTNPGVTTSPLMGLAEYTNANFFSEDRTFPEDTSFLFRYPYPAHSSGSEADYPITLATGERVTRRYFTKVADGDTGYRFATVEFLRDYLQRYGLDPGRYEKRFALDESVYKDYASRLVPRAVGFSTALLDYFFRGKLDVDLVADPVDPSVLRLTGTNASTDPLVDGTLTLFAHDPNGLRSPALALDPTRVTDVAPGQALSSARFQAPENAERFIAVYQGTLGQEVKPQDPNLPGAVIGKVLGGMRVEEVFSDGMRWKIRTPRGVFLLPLTVAEFEQVRWGDADNTLLAQTPFGPGQPNRFVVYEVQRESGSAEFKTLTTPDGLTVEVSQQREAAFPFGMSLDTTVQFTHTIQYRQRLARCDLTLVKTWTVPNPLYPDNGYYLDSLKYGPLTVETVQEQTVPFNLSFAITLDLDQSFDFDFGGAKPYGWQLWDVAVDASGRLVAVVVVSLVDPDSPTVDIPVFRVNPQGGLDIINHSRFGPRFPSEVDPLLWALVDLSEGRVVASTADRFITLSRQQVSDHFWFYDSYRHNFERREGGPQAGFDDKGWSGGCLGPVGNYPTTIIAEVQLQGGDQAISADGWLRGELQDALNRAGLFGFPLRSRQTVYDFLYHCTSGPPCSVVRIVSTDTDVFPDPATLDDALRARFAPDGARIVFLAEGVSEGLEETTAALVWDPATPRAQLLPLPQRFRFLRAATRTTAMVTSGFCWPNCTSSLLISLDGAQGPAVFPDVELSESFTLLDSNFLYNMMDGKFYRLQPPLRRTALPARLADVAGNPIGDYHAIRLP